MPSSPDYSYTPPAKPSFHPCFREERAEKPVQRSIPLYAAAVCRHISQNKTNDSPIQKRKPGILHEIPGSVDKCSNDSGMAAYSAGPTRLSQGLCLMLFCDGTNRVTVEPAVAAHEVDSRIEAHVPRVVRVIRIKGRRPIVPVRTTVEQGTAVPAACGRKEDAVTVLSRNLITILSTLRSPGPCALPTQLLPLFLRRSTPPSAPVLPGSIIGQIKAGLVVHRAMLAFCIVLGECNVFPRISTHPEPQSLPGIQI